MNALFQRSQGIPRLINIIADRSLVAAFAKERMDVTAAMVHDAANEVQLGERQVRRVRWPWLLAALSVLAVVALLLVNQNEFQFPGDRTVPQSAGIDSQVTSDDQMPPATVTEKAAPQPVPVPVENTIAALDPDWLKDHQSTVWQGLASMWSQPGAVFTIQAACNGDSSLGYACLRDQGNWLKIKRLGLPVVLMLQAQQQFETPSYLLLQGIDDGRLLVGEKDALITVSKASVESRWLGAYLIAWPQAPGWPAFVGRGDTGPAVTTIMEMATLVDVPYHGAQVFDAAFELWLKSFQVRNGLDPDGIVGRNTLLHLMTASIKEPKLLLSWE